MKKTIFAVLISILALSAFGAGYRVQKVKVLGSLQHKVIYQSTDLKKVRGANVLKGKLVTRWGTEVFEVVTGYYACNTSNVCKLTEYDRVATYRKCEVKNSRKVVCRGRIGGDNYTGDRDIIINESPDRVYDEYDNGRRNGYDDYSEYPERDNGSWEYGDIVLF